MISRSYILFIGTIQPRKNIEYIIKAFKQISEHYPHQLILAGAPGDSSENAEKLITEFGLNDRVTLLGYISDEERDNLYRHADVFVYPSKYEGFGLVLLEAMSYNIPVITADNSALPEAAGDAALYCDAEKPETLAKALHVLFSQPETRNTLIANSQKQIAKFTWQICAEQTSRVYQALAKQEHVK
jgi:glycosyltransferase involved in cell wall biosynthesis